MKNLSIEIDNIINKELSLINKKINGITVLEILKYKILDNLKESNISIKDFDISSSKSYFEDEFRKIDFKIVNGEISSSNKISELKNDLLLIFLDEFTRLDIIDHETGKNINIRCSSLTGIVLSKGLKYSININKNSLFLEMNIEDKFSNIEKTEENTI